MSSDATAVTSGDINIYAYPQLDAADAPDGSLVPGISDEDTAAAFANYLAREFGTNVSDLIRSFGLDPEQEAAALEIIDRAVADGRESVDPAVQSTVEAQLGDEGDVVVQSIMDQLMAFFREMAEEERTEEAGSTDPEAGAGLETGGASNWFVILTRALADIQSKWLSLLQDAYGRMQENVGEGEEQQSAFIEAQAEVQAYAKLFGMASETTSTVIKTLGDGLTSIARKQ